MSIEAAACAVAARLEGYPAFAEVILEQQLSPHAIAAMLRMSAAKDGMSLAVIVLAAGTARHMAEPCAWNGETERVIALDALHDDAAFKRAASHCCQDPSGALEGNSWGGKLGNVLALSRGCTLPSSSISDSVLRLLPISAATQSFPPSSL